MEIFLFVLFAVSLTGDKGAAERSQQNGWFLKEKKYSKKIKWKWSERYNKKEIKDKYIIIKSAQMSLKK